MINVHFSAQTQLRGSI